MYVGTDHPLSIHVHTELRFFWSFRAFFLFFAPFFLPNCHMYNYYSTRMCINIHVHVGYNNSSPQYTCHFSSLSHIIL